jgi:hypothetical protein
MNALTAARAYLSQLSPAISGAGGHDATFRAACCLVRFGLSDSEAMALLNEWNGTHCQPPWTETELAHKFKDAQRAAAGERSAFPVNSAVRVQWTIERKMPKSTVPCQTPPTTTPVAEVLPYIAPSGHLVIPFNCAPRFHWWKTGGMTPTETRRWLELKEKRYSPEKDRN